MIPMFIEGSELKDFCKANNLSRQIINQYPVISKINHANYGMVYHTADNVIIYSKHKAVEINKSKPTPKVCTNIQKTLRVVTEQEIKEHFNETTPTEILALELIEEKKFV